MILEREVEFSSFKEGLDNALRQKSRATSNYIPGGTLNFRRFETDNIFDCISFIKKLITESANVNCVSLEDMRSSVQIMMTGGGSHLYQNIFCSTLSVEVRREDEIECLISGLNFITLIPKESYYFTDALVHQFSSASEASDSAQNLADEHHYEMLERPSPDPPKYAVTFETRPKWQLPCLLVNIGSGVSIIKVDEGGNFDRVSGTSLGGGTLWGLLSLLTPAKDFDGDEYIFLSCLALH